VGKELKEMVDRSGPASDGEASAAQD